MCRIDSTRKRLREASAVDDRSRTKISAHTYTLLHIVPLDTHFFFEYKLSWISDVIFTFLIEPDPIFSLLNAEMTFNNKKKKILSKYQSRISNVTIL